MCILGATIVVLLAALGGAEREWTDNTGTHKVKAELIGVEQDKVILRKENGRRIEVPLSRLSKQDRAYVKRFQGALPARQLPPATPSQASPEDKQRAEQLYNQLVDAYLHGKWAELAEAQRALSKAKGFLSAQQREEVTYVRQAAAKCRPAWWQACKSTRKTVFTPTIWNRAVPVPYEPGDKTSFQFGVKGRRVVFSVSWNPSDVESDAPASDEALARHGCTKGDQTEVNIWRLLTHNRLLAAMPPASVIEIYSRQSEQRLAFEHFKEFRAKVEILKNCSPSARRMEMVMILAGFTNRESDNVDARTRRALGHMFLAEVLADPSKWPSVRLPNRGPQKDLLRSIAMSIKTKINAKNTWTIAEDRALREAAERFCRANGQNVLQTGKVVLPNRKTFMLMAQADRPFRAERIAWLRERLEATIGGRQPDTPSRPDGIGSTPAVLQP